MTWRWARPAALVAGLAGLAPVPLAGQQPHMRELGIQGTVLATDPAMLLGGVYGAFRASRRTRVALTASAGETGGAVAWRGELLAHFLLNPRTTQHPGVYGGGGVAIAGSEGNSEGYVVVLIGVESRPGVRSGWFLEGGLGGGFRAAAGWRWRWGG
ncbi:MAG: hypothetical protein ACM3OH_07280 [Bacillota bacterium]